MKEIKDLTPIDVIDELIEGLESNKQGNLIQQLNMDEVIKWLERQKKYYKT